MRNLLLSGAGYVKLRGTVEEVPANLREAGTALLGSSGEDEDFGYDPKGSGDQIIRIVRGSI